MSTRPQLPSGPAVPADEEAEGLLIGTLLAEGLQVWELVRAIADRSGSELLNRLQYQPLWDTIRHRGRRGVGFDLACLNSDHEGKMAIEAAGGFAIVAGIGGISPLNLPTMVDRLVAKADARTTRKTLLDAVEFIEQDPDAAAVIAGHASRALAGIGRPRSGFPAPVKLSEWLSKPMPQRPEIIRGMLRRGDKLTLGGSSKSKKTWLVSHLALCISAGRPWMGFQTVRTPVLYLNLELPEDTFHDRMGRLCSATGIRMEDADFTTWNLRGTRASVEGIAEALDGIGIPLGLVVIDPLYKILGDRVENAAEQMADLFNELDAIAARHKCALVIPAHYSKGNQSEKEAIDRISGSGVFGRDADAIVSLTAHDKPDCFAVESILRSFAPVEPFVVRWEFPTFVREDHLDPSELKKRPGAKTQYSRDDFVDLLGPKGMTLPELRQAAQVRMGMSRPKAYAMFKELLGKRIVLKPGSSNSTIYVAKE